MVTRRFRTFLKIDTGREAFNGRSDSNVARLTGSRALQMRRKNWRSRVRTATRNAHTARSAKSRRLCYSIAMAPPARHREQARKILPPAIQRSVSKQTGTDTPYMRGQVGSGSRPRRSDCFYETALIGGGKEFSHQISDGPPRSDSQICIYFYRLFFRHFDTDRGSSARTSGQAAALERVPTNRRRRDIDGQYHYTGNYLVLARYRCCW